MKVVAAMVARVADIRLVPTAAIHPPDNTAHRDSAASRAAVRSAAQTIATLPRPAAPAEATVVIAVAPVVTTPAAPAAITVEVAADLTAEAVVASTVAAIDKHQVNKQQRRPSGRRYFFERESHLSRS